MVGVGLVQRLPLGFVFALSMLKMQERLFLPGSIGRPIYQTRWLSRSAIRVLEEPMWVYLGFMRRADREERFDENPRGIRGITSLRLTTPIPLCSIASKRMLESGVLTAQAGPRSLLEIGFDGSFRKETADFRPHLPLVFQL